MLQADVRLVRGVRIVFIRSGEVDSTSGVLRRRGHRMSILGVDAVDNVLFGIEPDGRVVRPVNNMSVWVGLAVWNHP